MKIIESPNNIAETISMLLMSPLKVKDIRFNIVEIINPEFRISLWNSSKGKNKNNNNITSAKYYISNNQNIEKLFKENIIDVLESNSVAFKWLKDTNTPV